MLKQTHNTLLKITFIILMLLVGVGNVMAGTDAASANTTNTNTTSVNAADTNTEKLTFSKIHQFVLEMLNVDVTANGWSQKFIRWETPVRYYLTGLEKYPKLEKIFVEKMNEVAQITGLDIKRHKQIHLKYQRKEQSKSGTWPKDGLRTNAVVYFFDDVEVFKEDELMKLLLGILKTTPTKSYEQWFALTKEKHGYSDRRYTHNNEKGFAFLAHMSDMPPWLTISNKNLYFDRDSLFSTSSLYSASMLVSRVHMNEILASAYNLGANEKGVDTYQPIGKAFLESLYKSDVYSGLPKPVAAFKMARYIAEKLNVKINKE